jgi:hypothetical protein
MLDVSGKKFIDAVYIIATRCSIYMRRFNQNKCNDKNSHLVAEVSPKSPSLRQRSSPKLKDGQRQSFTVKEADLKLKDGLRRRTTWQASGAKGGDKTLRRF